MGGGRGGRGRIPVDASEPGAAGFKLLVAATGEGDEAHVGDEVRLVPGGAEDEEEDDVVLIGEPSRNI